MSSPDTQRNDTGLRAGSAIGGTLENFQKTENGDMFLKYKLIDDSFGLSGFRLADLSKIDKDAIGKPFPKQVKDPLSTRMHDGHLWSMLPNAGFQDHLNEAWNNAEGYVVDISNELDRNLAVKGGSDIPANSTSKYVTLKIIDPERKQLYNTDRTKIPKAVSIGVFDHDYGANGNVIKNYNVVHVMPVDSPAWQDAKLIDSCNGTEQYCTKALRGAAYPFIDTSMLKDAGELTSLNYSSENKPIIMSSNESTGSIATADTNGTVVAAKQPVLRLKTSGQNQGAPIANQSVPQQTAQNQVTDPNAVQANVPVQEQKPLQDDPDLQKMNMQLQQLRKDAELEKKKNMIRSKIPRDKFVVKDKFNNEAFEKEVERMSNKNWEEADFDSYYNNEREMLALIAAQRGGYSGYLSYNNQVAANTGTPDAGNGNGTPNALLGGADNSSQKVAALRNVIRMIGGSQ